jgi:hypothetical protein
MDAEPEAPRCDFAHDGVVATPADTPSTVRMSTEPELVSAGAEPRVVQSHRVVPSTGSLRLRAGAVDKEHPEAEIAAGLAISLDVTLSVRANRLLLSFGNFQVDPNRPALDVDVRIHPTQYLDRETMEQMGAAFVDSFERLTSAAVEWELAPQGLAATSPPQSMEQSGAQFLRIAIVRWPKVPIGVGARWRHVATEDGSVRLLYETEYAWVDGPAEAPQVEVTHRVRQAEGRKRLLRPSGERIDAAMLDIESRGRIQLGREFPFDFFVAMTRTTLVTGWCKDGRLMEQRTQKDHAIVVDPR